MNAFSFRRPLHRTLAGFATVLAMAPALCAAQSFPDHPITLIIPYTPGGQTDTMARVLAEKLGQVLNKAIVVENRGGATGSLAARFVARSAPDGYTLLFGTGGPMSINPVLHKESLGYDPIKDFTPIAYIANSPNLIAANPSFPAKTVSELIAFAKANPGKLDIGSTTGSDPDMMSELFRYQTGVDYRRIPYPNGAPLMNDVLAGHVPILIDGIISVQPQVVAHSLNAIAVSGAQRLPSLPNVPTISETIPGFVSSSWFSVFAPAHTPHNVVMKLNTAINQVLALPDVKARYSALGAVVVGGAPEKLRDHVAAQLTQWTKLVKDTGMKLE
jgi:tripartite-type tricarboxylate transporter receptor subunit TctC